MKKILMATLVLCSVMAFGQKVELANSQMSFNVFPLVLSYEGKIDANKSFTLAGGLGFAAWYAETGYSTEPVYLAIPIFYGGVRNYYKRNYVRKNNLRHNSGNYVGLLATYQTNALGEPTSLDDVLAHLETSNIYTVGPVWGIERNYASGIHLGWSIGAGVIGGKYIDTGVTFIGEFEFGLLLFQKK